MPLVNGLWQPDDHEQPIPPLAVLDYQRPADEDDAWDYEILPTLPVPGEMAFDAHPGHRAGHVDRYHAESVVIDRTRPELEDVHVLIDTLAPGMFSDPQAHPGERADGGDADAPVSSWPLSEASDYHWNTDTAYRPAPAVHRDTDPESGEVLSSLPVYLEQSFRWDTEQAGRGAPAVERDTEPGDGVLYGVEPNWSEAWRLDVQAERPAPPPLARHTQTVELEDIPPDAPARWELFTEEPRHAPRPAPHDADHEDRTDTAALIEPPLYLAGLVSPHDRSPVAPADRHDHADDVEQGAVLDVPLYLSGLADTTPTPSEPPGTRQEATEAQQVTHPAFLDPASFSHVLDAGERRQPVEPREGVEPADALTLNEAPETLAWLASVGEDGREQPAPVERHDPVERWEAVWVFEADLWVGSLLSAGLPGPSPPASRPDEPDDAPITSAAHEGERGLAYVAALTVTTQPPPVERDVQTLPDEAEGPEASLRSLSVPPVPEAIDARPATFDARGEVDDHVGYPSEVILVSSVWVVSGPYVVVEADLYSGEAEAGGLEEV